MLKIPSKVYDVLKWVCLIGLPAASALIFAIGTIWGFDPGLVIATIAAVQTFLGTVLGISNYNYNKELNAVQETTINQEPEK